MRTRYVAVVISVLLIVLASTIALGSLRGPGTDPSSSAVSPTHVRTATPTQETAALATPPTAAAPTATPAAIVPTTAAAAPDAPSVTTAPQPTPTPAATATPAAIVPTTAAAAAAAVTAPVVQLMTAPEVARARTARVEVRVWQNVGDELDLRISARSAAGSWRTLGIIPLPLDDGVSPTGHYRYGDITLGVSLPDAARTANVDVRVWQHVSRSGLLYISARPSGGSWSVLGTVHLPLDDGRSASEQLRYGDIFLDVPPPSASVITLAGRARAPGLPRRRRHARALRGAGRPSGARSGRRPRRRRDRGRSLQQRHPSHHQRRCGDDGRWRHGERPGGWIGGERPLRTHREMSR